MSSTFVCLLNVETHKPQHQKNPFGALRNLEGHQPRHRDIAKHSLEQFSPLAKLLRQWMLRENCFLSCHLAMWNFHRRKQSEATTTNQKQPETTNWKQSLSQATTSNQSISRRTLHSHCKATAQARFNVSDKMVWEFRCLVNTLATAGTANKMLALWSIHAHNWRKKVSLIGSLHDSIDIAKRERKQSSHKAMIPARTWESQRANGCCRSSLTVAAAQFYIAERSLEVKLPTICTDERQRWEESEKKREAERRSEKRKNQKKEDAGAWKGIKVAKSAKHCLFPMFWGFGGSKSRLAKAAGARPSGRNQKLHALVAQSRFGSQKTNYTSRDPKQEQRMFPPRSCAIQNSWSCLAQSCLLFYSFIHYFNRTNTRQPKKKGEEGRQAPEPKKREEGRQAPEPQPEQGGTSKSWRKRTFFLRKERREKKGDKHRNQSRENKGDKHPNPSRNQKEPANHDETVPLSWRKKEERRRGTSTETPAGTRRNQQIMMEQNPLPEERKKREEGRQAPEPQPEPRKPWWLSVHVLWT